MDVWDWSELVGIFLLAAILLCLTMLFVRRRLLSARHGMYDCAMRRQRKTPGTGWVLGVARYRDDALQWYRVFSLSWRPKRTFQQREWRAVSQRLASVGEQAQLFAGQHVITLERITTGERCELAADEASLTGLRSWLEASVPLSR